MKTTIYTLLLVLTFSSVGFSQNQFRFTPCHTSLDTNSNLLKFNKLERYNQLISINKSKKMTLDSIGNSDSLAVLGPARFYYDDLGRDTCTIHFNKDDAWKPWHPYFKETISYTKNSQIKEYSEYTFNRVASKWVLYDTRPIHYAADGLSIKEYLIWYNNYNGTMDTLLLTYYQLDSTKKLLFDIDSLFQPYGIEPAYKTTYFYDSADNFTSMIRIRWDKDSSRWENYFKDSINYYKTNLINQHYVYLWNDSTLNWQPLSNSNNFYNSQDLLIQTDNYSSKDSILGYQYFFSYDSNNFPYEMLIKRIDTSYQLKNSERHQRINNQYGDPADYYMFTWDSNISSWSPAIRIKSNFDINYDVDNAIYPFRFQSSIQYNKIILSESFFDYDTTLNQWDTDSFARFYFYSLNEVLHTSKSISNKNTNVYPNPTSDYIHFDIPLNNQDAQIEVFDITGKLIYQAALGNDKNLSVNSFNKGLYLFRIVSQNSTYSGKFMVE
jgi:hypothetical protein